jgi:hypothetical protein
MAVIAVRDKPWGLGSVSGGGGVGVDTRRSRVKSYISTCAKMMIGPSIYL